MKTKFQEIATERMLLKDSLTAINDVIHHTECIFGEDDENLIAFKKARREMLYRLLQVNREYWKIYKHNRSVWNLSKESQS